MRVCVPVLLALVVVEACELRAGEATRVAVLPFGAPEGGRVAGLTVAQTVAGTLLELEGVHVAPLSEVEKQQAELGGGTRLVYELKCPGGKELGRLLSETVTALTRRAQLKGVRAIRISAVGKRRIAIELPGAAPGDVQWFKHWLPRVGKIEFRIGVPRDTDRSEFAEWYRAAAAGEPVEGYEKVYAQERGSRVFYLLRGGAPEMTGRDITVVYPSFDAYGKPAVGLRLTAAGSRKLAKITEDNIGWLLCIVLEGEVISAGVIEGRVTGHGLISGDFTRRQVDWMIRVLRKGGLPVELALVEEAPLGGRASGGEAGDGALAEFAERFGYDTVVYGTMAQAAGGRNVVTGCVFDARAGRTLGCNTVDAEDWFVMRLQLNGTLHPWLVQRVPLRVTVAERLDRCTVRLDAGWLDGLERWQVLEGPGGVRLQVVSLTNESAVAATVTAGDVPEAGAVLVRPPATGNEEDGS